MLDASRRTPGAMGPVLPIVGRLVERALLFELLLDAEARHGKLVILGGEAGIGKTTVARDLAALARERGHVVLSGHCYDLMAAAPYGVWLDVADTYQRQQAAPERPAIPPVLASHDLDGFTNGAELARQVRAFLHDLTEPQPCLLVLEDVHWADPASLDMLRTVTARLDDMRILLVVTYRVDELTRQNPFYRQFPALIRESEGLRLDLRRLENEHLRELVLVRYTLPVQDVIRLTAYLESHAEGNPFFAVELLQALEDEAVLQQEAGAWLLGELHEVLVPPLVSNVIDMRVERLGDFMREPLAIAAVIGQEVLLDLWREVAGLDAQSMLAVMEAAVESHLLSASTDGTRVQFVHALTREALYGGMLPLRRRLVHQAVAEALLAQPQVDPDPVAYHFERAGDQRAISWLIRAGERAQRAYAWLTAHDRFMAAANLLADLPGVEGERARLLYRCGRLQRYSNPIEGIASLQLAVRMAGVAGDRILAAEARYSCGLLRCFADDWRGGIVEQAAGIADLEVLAPEDAGINWSTVNWMADALPVTELPVGNQPDPAAARLTAAGINHRRGGLPWFLAASGHLREAESMARRFGDHVRDLGLGPLVLSAHAHSRFGIGIARAALGDPQGARAAFAEAREMYERFDHHGVIAYTLLTEINDVAVPWYTTDIALRQALADEAELELERAGGAFPAGLSHRRAQLVVMSLDGRWREAREIVADSPLHGSYVLRRQVTRSMAPIARHQGADEEAWGYILSLVPDGPDAAPGSAVLLDAFQMQHLAVDLCLASNDFAAASMWLESNQRWLAWSGAVLGQAEHALGWGKYRHRSGDHDLAREHAARAIALARNPEQPLVLLAARRLLAEIRIVQEDFVAAREDLDVALALADACGCPIERALTLIPMIELAAVDPAVDGRMLAGEARTTFERLGARPGLERLDALTSIDPPTPPPVILGLTSRELEVLRLLAQGLTDAEIGTRLYISPRTASQHLRSIYAKLDVHSRAAATRYALEHQLA